MFAVVEIGGRQYKVGQGQKIEVEKLEEAPEKGVSFNRVLLVVGDHDGQIRIGQPYIEGASVEAKIINHFKGEKIRVVKFIPKKRHKKVQGHRQNYTALEVIKINS